ncbi:3343_t:CDS:2, partial [Entrophospora sp. SA101]
ELVPLIPMVENNSNTDSIHQELLNKLKTISEVKTELEQRFSMTDLRYNESHPSELESSET